MSFKKIFFSPDGRITRREFWLGHAMLLGATVVLSLIGGLVVGVLSAVPGLGALRTWGPVAIGAGVGVLALGGELILAMKRMHDRGASGLWVIAVLMIAVLANMLIGGQHLYAGENPLTPLTVGLSVFTMIMGGWLILELGFLRGTTGENAYGTDPVAGSARGSEPGPLLLTQAMLAERMRGG